MLPFSNHIAVRSSQSVPAQQKTIEVSNEDVLLSLVDENKRILPISDNNVFFAPLDESKTKGITMAQLKASSDLTDKDGNLANGINAYQLIGKVAEMAREIHADARVTDLFVADNKNRAQGNGISINKQMTELYQQKTKTDNIPFAAVTFNRVFCNIILSRYHTDSHVANIVVATNQRGLQVAVGANCKACRNQTILGANRLVSSYGNNSRSQMPLEEFVKCVYLMLQGYRFEDDMAALRRMQQIAITQEEMVKIVGELTAIRVAFDSSSPSVRNLVKGDCDCYPMSQTQINRFMESLLLTCVKRNGHITLYDVYQSATALYKVYSMDLPNILPQNKAFVEFINDRYGLGI